MTLDQTYNIVAGLLLLVRAGFIVVPAWSRWTRNLVLVSKGVKTTGRYKGDCIVTFILDEKRSITFSTWKLTTFRYSIGDELPVLYHPANPYRAEVMSTNALWREPLLNLTIAITLALIAVLLFQGMDIGIASAISLIAGLVCYFLARLALYYLYPASRLQPQLNKQKQRLAQENKESVIQDTQEAPHIHHITKRKAREQLLHDMVFGFDPSDTPPLHEEEP